MMRTKKALKMFLLISAILCFYSPALFAVEPYDTIVMTSETGNTTAKPEPYTYGLNELPWLFLGLKDMPYTDTVGDSNTTSTWTWLNPSGDNLSYIRYSNGTLNGQWTSFSPSYWDTIKKLGNWTIDADTTLTTGSEMSARKEYFTGSTSFKVVPEPASMILYVLGGLSLATGFFRKKKS